MRASAKLRALGDDYDNVRTKIFGIRKFTLSCFLSCHVMSAFLSGRVVSAPCRHHVETCRNMACYGDVDVET